MLTESDGAPIGRVLSDAEQERLFEAANVHVALRAGQLRISPHLYNTYGDVARALSILNES